MKIFLTVISYLLISQNLLASTYPDEKYKLFKELTKKPQSLKIKTQIPLQEKDKIFLPSYWKVYYQNDKIVGEELFVNGKLSYYYIYFYTKNKVYQKGFFWAGIYTRPFSVKLTEKYIKAGYVYKNIPDSYRVFDRQTLQLVYTYIYPNKEV